MKQETIERIRKFSEDRDWDQFHSPANLAKSIVIEAAELLECFQWNDEEYDIQHVKEELIETLCAVLYAVLCAALFRNEVTASIPHTDSLSI